MGCLKDVTESRRRVRAPIRFGDSKSADMYSRNSWFIEQHDPAQVTALENENGLVVLLKEPLLSLPTTCCGSRCSQMKTPALACNHTAHDMSWLADNRRACKTSCCCYEV